jgi:hypothetical protein
MVHDNHNNTLFTDKRTKGLETPTINLLDASSDLMSVLGAYLTTDWPDNMVPKKFEQETIF